MQIHNLIQGTEEWHQFRLEHFGASEAAAMLGLSSKIKRTELLYMKKTGTAKEFSDFVQEKILDHGHEAEGMARPIIERILGEDLYPVTCSDGMLSASCDGLTMCEGIGWEHKQFNPSLAAAVSASELPDEYAAQVQQCLLVTGADKWIFTVSNGTEENMVWMEIYPNAAWFDRIRKGWEQFSKDLAEYQHVEVLPPPTAVPAMGLPALSIRVDGSISLQSNLSLFGAKLTEFVERINQNPSDDQAFADCEAAVNVLQKAQDALEAAQASALAQTSTIDEMCRTVAMYRDLARNTRLTLEKVVETRKKTIRFEIQQEGKAKAEAHIATLNQRLGRAYMPTVPFDFATAMKGKRTIASLRDAVDTELARFKIAADAIAERIQANLTTMRELAADYQFLFVDTPQIVLKATDDCTTLIRLRIAEHKVAEEKRLDDERARIAEEERIKAEAKVREEQVAAQKLIDDEAARAAAEANLLAAQTTVVDVMPPNVASAATEASFVFGGASKPTQPYSHGRAGFGGFPTAPKTQPSTSPTLTLGKICTRIAPLSITADGLKQIGFEPAGRERAAVLYHEKDWPAICIALMNHIYQAREVQQVA